MSVLAGVLMALAVLPKLVEAQASWEPEWKYACWNATTGAIDHAMTPGGWCQSFGVHDAGCVCANCTAPGMPTVINGLCACAAAAVAERPTDPKKEVTEADLQPAGLRCRLATLGELTAPVNGADPTRVWQYACFLNGTNRLAKRALHLKPDGFCGKAADGCSASFECEGDADDRGFANECVPLFGGEIYSCMTHRAKLLAATSNRDFHCMHITAAELSIILRGPPTWRHSL